MTAPPTLPDVHFRSWIRRQLKRLFSQSARDLPWRRHRDPYAIWVSEIMLQQTQVATVVPFFQRFMERFPNILSLAQAEEQQVLKMWEGLGYYRRARSLHRAAQILAAEREGIFPNDPAFIQELPGLGRYTANAILSQAFERRLPILEANSQRLFCRLFGVMEPASNSAQKFLWSAAEAILPKTGIGDFNQALMELGALICTPRDPQCPACPLKSRCFAFEHRLQAAIPARKEATPAEKVRELCLVLWRKGRILFTQIPPDADRWSNLWEFPRIALHFEETLEDAATRLLARLALSSGNLQELTVIRHSVTRFQITLTAWQGEIEGGVFSGGYHRWVAPEDLADFPVSTPQGKIIKTLKASCLTGPRRQD